MAASLVREAFPHADDVNVRIEDEVSFVDAGENFDAARLRTSIRLDPILRTRAVRDAA